MPLYRYVKRVPRRSSRGRFILPFVMMTAGMMLLLWVSWPILSFQILTKDLFAQIVSPITDVVDSQDVALAPVILAAGNEEVLSESISDYTNANIWFPTKPQKKITTSVDAYKVTIPKLRIKDALVILGGDDLNVSLIHYGGTSLPGEYGNAVIFGHSTLPQLYNPKNYNTIFSLLPTLTVGDEVFVEFDGVKYRYVIYEMKVTKPTDLSALEQRFDQSYITLVTCVPPGTYWERLNVKAKLSSL